MARKIPASVRGLILARIEAAVQAGSLEWTCPDAYAGLMNILFPEDFAPLDPPLLPTGNDRLAVLIRTQPAR